MCRSSSSLCIKIIEHMSDYLFDYLSITEHEKKPCFQGFSDDSEGNRTPDSSVRG